MSNIEAASSSAMSQDREADAPSAGKCAPNTSPDSTHEEVRTILYNMEQDPSLMGISSLGRDGVLRSWTADRDVVDAVPLRPALIKAYLDLLPYDKESEAMFRGVDGRNVPREQWFDPPQDVRPLPLPEEHRERDEEVLERNRKLYREKREQLATGTLQSCPLRVLSSNNVD